MLDGADNTGKSKLSENLAREINAIVIQQPSPSNSVGFLRNVVKKEQNIEPFARQLLHSISHTVDFYETMLISENTIVMDRCYISALVYGELCGLNQNQLNLIHNIHKSIYSRLNNLFDVHIFILTKKQPFRTNDESIYEQVLNWQDINMIYQKLSRTCDKYFFLENENIDLIDLDQFNSIDNIVSHIRNCIKL
ncbi:hypothetical protein [Desulfoluna spongiiphila]|uniref:hypothetical protein n=1 Tax=Desulfoluna spongiiphila TaxID=419481 RepID=UPI0015870E6E|nr:hypothetical protein [Desulfoluna spongiiphila]